ncbi:VOC family protein [Pasteurella multocida]
MSNPVSWFEIHVENLQRAKTFGSRLAEGLD